MALAAHEDPDALLARMKRGDREAAAEFVTRFSGQIRRRISGKLGTAMRRLFDSQEIMSTLGRRLDAFVSSGQLRASTMAELWALLGKLADNSLIEKARVFRSLESREGEDSPLAQKIARRMRDSERQDPDGSYIEIDRAMQSLKSAQDREILTLWLHGSSHVEIAAIISMEPAAVRKRWQGIRERLRELYESGGC